ncbi:MAG: hypothetical protein S4CHLAM2_06650 [Chlamydiales bacterium]|nr:hypothetical protein [Chlamydiales bacterium]
MSGLETLNPVTQDTEVKKAHGVPDLSRSKKGDMVNVIALAYYYLIESATTSSESALVDAKQLRANGQAQQKLNSQEAGLKWNYVPKLQEDHHKTVYDHLHWNGNTLYLKRYTHKWTTVKNQGEVTNAEAKNQRVVAERQFLTQKMSVLQQSAKTAETHVNSVAGESTQTLQEGQKMMQMLESLTFKALIRRPARG